nr:hypothetical protein [uncultured Sphingomonas sp.]
MVSLTIAAAAKVTEAVFAFLLYRKPMDELVGGPAGALRRIYLEGLLVTAAAVAPAAILMIWSDWAPTTPLPLIAAAMAVGVAGWAGLLIRLRHPLYLETLRLLRLGTRASA